MRSARSPTVSLRRLARRASDHGDPYPNTSNVASSAASRSREVRKRATPMNACFGNLNRKHARLILPLASS